MSLKRFLLALAVILVAVVVCVSAIRIPVLMWLEGVTYDLSEEEAIPGLKSCQPGYASWNSPCVVDDERTGVVMVVADPDDASGEFNGMMTVLIRVDVLEADHDPDQLIVDVEARTNAAWRLDPRSHKKTPICLLANERTTESFPFSGTPAHAHMYAFVCRIHEDVDVTPFDDSDIGSPGRRDGQDPGTAAPDGIVCPPPPNSSASIEI